MSELLRYCYRSHLQWCRNNTLPMPDYTSFDAKNRCCRVQTL